eukprot:scaffold48_cov311-Pinguiococcus_pyrenoidosus.AAC.212
MGLWPRDASCVFVERSSRRSTWRRRTISVGPSFPPPPSDSSAARLSAPAYLGPHEQERHPRGVVHNLGQPLGAHVLKRRGRDDGEADEEHVRLGIGERPEAIVVLLPRCVPQAQVDGLAVHHDVGAVVVEHRGNVFSGEGVGGVRDEQAGLSDRAVAHDDALDVLHGSEASGAASVGERSECAARQQKTRGCDEVE